MKPEKQDARMEQAKINDLRLSQSGNKKGFSSFESPTPLSSSNSWQNCAFCMEDFKRVEDFTK